jgi:predicted dehydrogenase
MARVLNVALIGYGLAGRKHHARQIAAVEGLRLAAIVSSRRAEIRADFPEAAILAKPEDAFADPTIDLVVVATPNDSHAPLAAAALRAGKAVVVDKPFTTSVAETEALIAVAGQTGGLLSVYQNRRWDGDFLTLRRLIGEGSLGEVVYFENHFDRFNPTATGNWREETGAANGTWYDLGPHLADQALVLFGRPLGIAADMAVMRAGVAAVDYFHVLMRYRKTRVVLMSNYLAADDDLRLVVHGTKASFVIRGFDASQAAKRTGKRAGADWNGADYRAVLTDATGGQTPVTLQDSAWTCYYEGVRDAILKKGPLPVTAAEGLTVMQVLAAADRSAAERREVAFG